MSNWLSIEKECEVDFLLRCNNCKADLEGEVEQGQYVMVKPHACHITKPVGLGEGKNPFDLVREVLDQFNPKDPKLMAELIKEIDARRLCEY